MDHLPVPADKKKPNPPHLFFGRYEVRFYGNLPELETSFIEHAVSQRIIEEDRGEYTLFLNDYFKDSGMDAYMAKSQAWAWFRLIHEVFGPVNPEELLTVTHLQDETEVRVLDSMKLVSLMSEWRLNIRKLSKEAQQTIFEKTKLATVTVWKFCNQIDNHNMAEDVGDMLMLFSIRILVSSIWDMLYYSDFGFEDLNNTYKFSAELIKYPRMPQSYRPLALLMDTFGWCHHAYLRVMSTYHLTTVWTIALTHGRDRPGGCHDRCHTATKCIAGDLDDQKYQAVHLTEGCCCEPVGPDMTKVKKILSKHQIPIIRCSINKRGDPVCEVLASTKSTRHIAISHVWADGMLIPDGNRVYRCQFLKVLSYLYMTRAEVRAEKLIPTIVSSSASSLLSRVLKLASTSPIDIWYDIFCIPNDNTIEVKQLRRWAISRITPVYASAEAIMVLDKGLINIKKTDMTMVEELARIASSRWTTRCWTFSEASLAAKSPMVFCIGDVARRKNETIFATPNSPEFKNMDVQSMSTCRDLATTAFHPYNVFWLSKEANLSEYVKFGTLWNSLASRSTSCPSDVWGLMATLMGLDSAEITQLPQHERLPALLKDVRRIPASFIFRNLPRSTEVPPHMRWMPTKVEGRIRDSDGTFVFVQQQHQQWKEGGICFDGDAKYNFIFTVNNKNLFSGPKFTVVVPLALSNTTTTTTTANETHDNNRPSNRTMTYEITLHNPTAIKEIIHSKQNKDKDNDTTTTTTITKLCLSLFIAHRAHTSTSTSSSSPSTNQNQNLNPNLTSNPGIGIGSETNGESGIGYLITVTQHSPLHWVKGDFLSSLGYKIIIPTLKEQDKNSNHHHDDYHYYTATYAGPKLIINY